MWRGVTVLTKPASRPVTTATAKAWSRIEHAYDDTIIETMIDAAVAAIDGPSGVGVAMMQQTWRKTLDAFPTEILLPGWPIKSVSTITYIDPDGAEQTINGSTGALVDLGSEPVRVRPLYGQSWPATRAQIGAVKVDYLVGEASSADIDRALISAVLMLTAYRYERREAVAAETLGEIPLGVSDILNQYRRSYVAA